MRRPVSSVLAFRAMVGTLAPATDALATTTRAAASAPATAAAGTPETRVLFLGNRYTHDIPQLSASSS